MEEEDQLYTIDELRQLQLPDGEYIIEEFKFIHVKGDNVSIGRKYKVKAI